MSRKATKSSICLSDFIKKNAPLLEDVKELNSNVLEGLLADLFEIDMLIEADYASCDRDSDRLALMIISLDVKLMQHAIQGIDNSPLQDLRHDLLNLAFNRPVKFLKRPTLQGASKPFEQIQARAYASVILEHAEPAQRDQLRKEFATILGVTEQEMRNIVKNMNSQARSSRDYGWAVKNARGKFEELKSMNLKDYLSRDQKII